MAATVPGTSFTDVWLLPMKSRVTSADTTGGDGGPELDGDPPPPPPQAASKPSRSRAAVAFIARID
jgi:hypothetical protein